MKHIIQINHEGFDIVIRCSTKHLIMLAETSPESNYTVVNKKRFVKDFIHVLQNMKPFSNAEGINQVEEMFDNAIDETYIESDSIEDKDDL